MAKVKAPTCGDCGKSLTGARTFIERVWRCPSCTYKYDTGKEPPAYIDPRYKRLPIQEETLFPLPPPREYR